MIKHQESSQFRVQKDWTTCNIYKWAVIFSKAAGSVSVLAGAMPKQTTLQNQWHLGHGFATQQNGWQNPKDLMVPNYEWEVMLEMKLLIWTAVSLQIREED